MALAQNWRRRGKFEEVTFIFPNAPAIPITVVWAFSRYIHKSCHSDMNRTLA